MAQLVTNEHYQKEYTKDFVSRWDDLIGWEGRMEAEGGFFRRLLHAYECNQVIDAATGTGFHAINLAQDGFEVTATDGSENMIQQTLANAKRLNAPLKDTRTVDWASLDKEFGENTFDALVCLGNAFTHLFDHETRRECLLSMYRVVRPGGMVIIDHRNYDDILENGFSTKHKYYYTGHGVDASPIEISRTMMKFQYTFPDGEQHYLTMYPLKQNYVSFLLEDAGLVDITRYGDFNRPYDHYDADFIQQIGFKPKEQE